MVKPDFSKKYFYTNFFDKSKKQFEIVTDIDKYAKDNGAVVVEYATKQFVFQLFARWKLSRRNKRYFEWKHSEWLKEKLYQQSEKVRQSPKNPAASRKKDRKKFCDLILSQKRRTAELRKRESGILVFAAISKLREEGKVAHANAVQEAIRAPKTVMAAVSYYRKRKDSPVTKSRHKSLALSLDCGLTKRQYQLLRENPRDQDSNRFPSYNDLLQAKKECYPKDITVSETEAVVSLQDLLDHTVSRFALFLESKMESSSLTFHYKWGFDGSSGQSEYKQLFEDKSASDSSVVITTIVPLQIVNDEDNTVIWKNSTPSSTRYTMPVRISYEKESSDSIKTEYNRVSDKIKNLNNTRITINNKTVTVAHKLYLTMLDGKSVNAIEENLASSKCYICKAGPKKLIDLSLANVSIATDDDSRFQYGLSPLHARINSFEYLLRLSYRLALPQNVRQKCSRLTEEQKNMVKERKAKIQEQFKSQLGLIVDKPQQGFGSSNDGNTARKFFEKTAITAKILGIDENLVKRFSVILTAINVSEQLNADKFGDYAKETARQLFQLYPFWPMTPTVHKLLLHGKEIILRHVLPIGCLSEEAIEHRNKDLKKIRNQYARKTSRLDNLTDIFNRFFVTSDPFMTHLRASTKLTKRPKDLPRDVMQLMENIEEQEAYDEDDYI